jgi:DMSO/TMAO reductase YedYZ molybdopterin-dependent catalytic subunit
VSTQFTEADISPRLWTNGALPVSEEYNSLLKRGFSEYKLRVDGLVEEPREFSYAQIKAMPKKEQITCHFCVQGWSGVAKWGGVPMRHVLDLVKPKPEAKYVVFYSFADGDEGGRYYDVHLIHNMRHELSLLAYEMNGQPLGVHYGAPLLRCENELGFKMVKWIEAIEFVDSFGNQALIFIYSIYGSSVKVHFSLQSSASFGYALLIQCLGDIGQESRYLN